MAFSLFVVVFALIVVSVAYFHYTQGFFSAAISAILCIFSALMAVSYHEVVVEKFLAGGGMSDMANGATVFLMFAVIYLVSRTVFDRYVPGNVTLPSGIDKGGALLMGIVAGVFAAGLSAFAAQTLPFNPALMGYARFAVEPEREANIPQAEGKRNMNRFLRDAVNTDQPLHLAEGDKQQAMLPADEILMQTLYRVSEQGALAGRPISEVHPDWLTELFGQRLGIQSAAKRTAVNAGGAANDVMAAKDDGGHADAGPYVLDRQLKQRAHEFPTIAKGGKDPMFPKVDPKKDPARLTVVLRTYFGKKARDAKDSRVRFSPSSVRLVTQKKDATGDLAWANYFPLGTVEDATEFYYNRPDDFMFVGGEAGEDSGVDLVFQVDREGFATGVGPNNDLSNAKIANGTFLEVKRMGRVDLSGQPLRPFGALKKSPAVAVMRKILVKNPPKEAVVAKEVTPEEMAQKLIGSWEAEGEGGSKIKLTIDEAQMVLAEPPAGGGAGLTVKGKYKVAPTDNGMGLLHDGVGTDGKLNKIQYTFSFGDNDALLDLVDQAAGKSWSFKRAGKTGASPAAPAPATPAPTPAPATAAPEAAPAVPKDASLVVTELLQSRKFVAAIKVPKGTSGEAPAGGGTVTVEEDKLKVITLPPVAVATLQSGPGELLNQLAVPGGSIMVQVEATPGKEGGGWAWKDRVGEIAVVDKDGGRHAAVGVWVLINGGKEVVVRFNADGGASLADYTPPAAPPTKVHLAFAIPDGQQVKQVVIGEAELKAFNPPVP